MKLTDTVIAGKSCTKLVVPEESALDDIALKVIRLDCPYFLAPIKTKVIDGELEICYELSEGIRMSYCSLKLNKNEFVTLLKSMLTPFKICNDWFLSYQRILLDPNYILIDKNGTNVKFVYIPLNDFKQTEKEIGSFFENVFFDVEIMDDANYAMKLLKVYKQSGNSIMALLETLTDEAESQAAEVLSSERSGENQREKEHIGKQNSKQNINQRETGASSRPGVENIEFGKEDVAGGLIGSLFGEEEESSSKGWKHAKTGKPVKEKTQKSGGFMDIFKGKSKNTKVEKEPAQEDRERFQKSGGGNESWESNSADNDKYQGKQEKSTQYDDDKTDIPSDDGPIDNNVLKLQLIDSGGYKCPRTIELDLSNGFAIVGRYDKSGNRQADFNFDSSLSFISRRHFRVEKYEDSWRIIDLESVNGTYLNGEEIVSNMPHILTVGDKIMISKRHRLIYEVV